MSLWKYKYFLDVVELKSFTKAGARNYVTQTAVSQQIASLEKMAGGTLLERGNGEICLTELGEIVYEYAREMVQTHERMLHEIERYKESSVVRIGIDSSINKLFWAKNAAILAAKILAASDEELLNKLKAYTAEQKEAVKAKAAKLDSIGYEAYLASK